MLANICKASIALQKLMRFIPKLNGICKLKTEFVYHDVHGEHEENAARQRR